MDYKEIKQLFNYLENNRNHFSSLQLEFIDSLRKQYKVTGLLTSVQSESLIDLREKINSDEIIPDPEFISGLYSQLQENYC
ncbi:MAG: hypothetical protein ACM3UT_07000 [Chloroflexota bacterium]